MKALKRLIALLLLCCGPAACLHAMADEITIGMLELTARETAVKSDALLLQSKAEVTITAMTARVTLKQRFRNDADHWVDGTYLFPLPEEATVDALTMRIGDRVIVGKIRERREAKRAYEAARKAGKQAALLESERPNLFTTSIANIAPGETIEVEIRYLQTVTYKDGAFSLRLPTTLTPRYIPGDPLPRDTELEKRFSADTGKGWARDSDQVADASRITPPQVRDVSGGTNPISISIDLDAGLQLADIGSSSHAIVKMQSPSGKGTAWNIGLRAGSVPMDRDFMLTWRPAVDAQPSAALFTEQREDAVYATLLMMPPQQVAQAALPREVIFIIDSSGSMGGASMRQAKKALLDALGRLKPGDMFNIVDFDSEARQLFAHPVPATADLVSKAKRFVNALQADGGTEMAKALTMALEQPETEGFLRQVLFMTDGSVGNEETLFTLIRQRLGQARLFTVGIGSAPNSYFMRKSAEFGRGSFTTINRLDQVNEKMRLLFRQLESPVLRDIVIRWPESAETEFFPNPVPDLYLGEPLVVHARLKKAEGVIAIGGHVQGRAWSRSIAINSVSGHSGMAKLWAGRKIGSLMDAMIEGKPEAEIKPQVLKLALEHQVASKYTSFVAIDETPVKPESAEKKQKSVSNRMPAGSTMQVPYPATATSAELTFWLGLLMLLITLLFYRASASVRES
jgi:Ca-activated chloride channel family protein